MEEKQYSVWVGSLSSNANEEILSDLFGKFGPVKSVVVMRDEQGKSKQFGYVNYYNTEVAECAAHVMDGYIIARQAIKTKGPKELQRLRAEQNAGKIDYRMFTDCLFFIDKRECTWKPGECLFRHYPKARLTEKVCGKWLERQCYDINCENRHPRLTRSGSLINDNAGGRCPSHNAFKCFGECGSQDCNTHFLEKMAYLDHVRLVKKKSTSPIATCNKCQAVFYSGAEKLDHRCYKSDKPTTVPEIQNFTSTRLQAEKDIAHPVAMYSSKSLAISKKSIPENPAHFAASPHNCSSADSCPGMHEDRLSNLCNEMNTTRISHETSFKNSNREGLSVSGDRCDNPCTQICAETSMSNLRAHRKNIEPIGVFWDIENCPIPKGKPPMAIVQKLRSVFFREKREVEFMCVCDISKEKKCIIEELNKAQVTVVHINSTSKNAADDKLRQSLRRFAQTYSRPATVILVSGDGNFSVELSDLRHRHNFNIICLHNVAASSALLGFAHETHRFDLFAEDLDHFIPTQVASKPLLDVVVTNLPQAKSITQLRSRLTKLSDNCGGKVITVSGSKAVIRFPNTEAAFRARRRLDKEELFGCIICASLLPQRREEKNPKTPTASTKSLIDVNLNNPGTLTSEQNEEKKQQLSTATYSSDKCQEIMQYQNNLPAGNLTGFPTPPYLNQQLQVYHPIPSYPGLFHPSMVHNMFHHPRFPHHPRVFHPACSFSPVVNNAVRRSPSPDQPVGGVDILVTNLNETVPRKELKDKLASVFREHCKVYSLVLHTRRGAPLRALVKVSKMFDAHVAISKTTGKIVHDKVIHVSIASDHDKLLCYLQDEVHQVLQEAPLNWLPLTTFLLNYEKKYRKQLDLRLLEQLKDSILVNGSTGCQTIGLLESNIETQLVEVDDTSFASDVSKLLHHYRGVITLTSFPALYWLEFHKELRPSSSGKLLVDLLSAIPNVRVTEVAHVGRAIQWIIPFRSPHLLSVRIISEENNDALPSAERENPSSNLSHKASEELVSELKCPTVSSTTLKHSTTANMSDVRQKTVTNSKTRHDDGKSKGKPTGKTRSDSPSSPSAPLCSNIVNISPCRRSRTTPKGKKSKNKTHSSSKLPSNTYVTDPVSSPFIPLRSDVKNLSSLQQKQTTPKGMAAAERSDNPTSSKKQKIRLAANFTIPPKS